MKKLLIVFLASICTSLTAQKLVPYRVDSKWGYADTSGKVVIPAAYNKAEFFSTDGFARIKRDGKTALINAEGKEVLPFKYNSIFDFESGLAAVCLGGEFNVIQGEIIGGKWGFINESFQEVIPCQYERVDNFKGDYAIVQTENNWGPWGVIDKTGKVILPFKYACYSFDMRPFPGLAWDTKPGILRKDISGMGERWQLINLKGAPVAPPYKAMHGDRELYDPPAAKVPVAPKGLLEILDTNGQVQKVQASTCQFQYLTGTNFRVGVPLDAAASSYRYAIISGNKTTLVPLGKYQYINYGCSDGLISVSKGELSGFVDCQTGKEVISPKYGYVDDFKNGYAYVAYNYVSHDRKGDGVINLEGVEFFKDSPAVHVVMHEGRYLLLDERNYLIEPLWLKGAALLGLKGNMLIYNDSVSRPCVAKFTTSNIHAYQDWREYCCPLFKDSNTFTGINITENRIRRMDYGSEYDTLYFVDSNDSILMVEKSGKRGIISLEGKKMVPPLYDDIVPFATKTGVGFSVTNDGMTGISDANGNLIVPTKYSINFETPGYQIIMIPEYDKMGLVKDGAKIIVPPEYNQMEPYLVMDENQVMRDIVFLSYKDEAPYIFDGEGRIGFTSKSASVEAMGTENPQEVYFTVYAKKKNGIFKAGAGLIIPTVYDNIDLNMSNGSSYFVITQKKKYGLADNTGKIIVPVVYDMIDATDENGFLFLLYDQKSKVFGLTKDFKIVEKKDE